MTTWAGQTGTDFSTSPFPAQPIGPLPDVTGQNTGPFEYAAASRTNEPSSARSAGRAVNTAKHIPKAAERQALAVVRREALLQAAELEAAAARDDLQQKAISGIDLRDSLRKLWRLRHLRTDDWSTIVNFLQVVTSNVEFESYNQDMAASVRCVIESHLEANADRDDIDAAVVLFERAKLNPWKALSFEGDETER